MQIRAALRTNAVEIEARWKRGRAIEAARRCDMLNQTRQPGTGYIDRRARALGFRAIFAERSGVAIGIHVSVLSILAVAVHGESCSVVSWTLCIENKDPWRRSSKDRRNRNAFHRGGRGARSALGSQRGLRGIRGASITGSGTRHCFHLLIYHGIHRIARPKLRGLVWAVLTILGGILMRMARDAKNNGRPSSLGCTLLDNVYRFGTSHCNAAKLFATIDWSDRNPSLRRPESNQRS
jgi:hypothetical protein